MPGFIRPSCFSLSVSVLALCVASLPLQAANAPSGVVAAIEKKYVVTEMTVDHEQVTKDGTTMAMKTAGVYSAPTTTMMVIPDNSVVDGKIKPPNMFMKGFLAKAGAKVLQTGDKVYITKIDSKNDSSGDVLKFTVVTVDSKDVTGSDSQKKYDAYITFHFKKGYLDETGPDDVEQAIESVLAPDAGSDDSKAETKPAEKEPPAKAPAVAKAAPPPPAPPAAPAAAPPTISIGESSTQVLQALGMPQQMVDLGKKKTFIYKNLNMKIIFQDDKVSDVQ